MTVTTDDLGTLLNDDELNVARAQMLIDDAVTQCSTIINPLPSAADVIVKRVAARAYVETTAARQYQLAEADAQFGAAPGPVGGVVLTRSDKRDLRRLAGTSSAFSIDQLPSTYAAPSDLPYWDQYTIPQASP